MKKLDASQFPTILRSLESDVRIQRFSSAIEQINESIEIGSIRNARFKEISHNLSSMMYDGWNPFNRNGAGPEIKILDSEVEVLDLYYSLSFSGTHAAAQAAKKIAKTKAEHPFVDHARKYSNELAPLVEAMSTLKAQIVMGRAPSTGPAKPVNPNKVIKTCACCRRGIAVERGAIHNHGYKVPYGYGFQTAGCFGAGYPPLETSTQGLVKQIEALNKHKDTTNKLIADPSKIEVVYIRRGTTPIKYVPGDEGWDKALQRHIQNLTREVKGAEHAIETQSKFLAEWVRNNPETKWVKPREIRSNSLEP